MFTLLIFSDCHLSSHSANALRKLDFLSSRIAALPNLFRLLYLVLALEIVHHLFIKFKNPAASSRFGKYDLIAATVDSSKIANAAGTHCLQLPG